MDAEDPHQSRLIKLISAEGHEFYVEKRCAMVSGTIKVIRFTIDVRLNTNILNSKY